MDSAIGLTALIDDVSVIDRLIGICGEFGVTECAFDVDRLCVSIFGPDDWTISAVSDWKESIEFVLGEDNAEESVDTAEPKLDDVSWVIGHNCGSSASNNNGSAVPPPSKLPGTSESAENEEADSEAKEVALAVGEFESFELKADRERHSGGMFNDGGRGRLFDGFVVEDDAGVE